MTDVRPQPLSDPAARRREQRGWYWYDWANSTFSTTVVTVILGPYLTSVAKSGAVDGSVQFLWFDLDPKAYFPACVTVSVLLQIFVLPVVGALADRSAHKRELLAGFAYAGATATMLLIFVTGGDYRLGGALFIFANLMFGCAIVVYNSFLPDIAEPDERDRVSSRGWAMGYAGGALLLVFNLVLVLFAEDFGLTDREAARWCLFSAGLWWAVFTVIPMLRLVNRRPYHVVAAEGWVVTAGFRQLGRTLRELVGFKITVLFLVAYLLYNDGIQAAIAFAATFGSEELGFGDEVLIGAILLVQVVAFFGALALGRIAARKGAKATVLGALVVWSVVVGYAFVIPAGNAPLFFLLAAAIGFVLGGSQALSRSLFSHLIPGGREAEYYAVYEVSDRGTSFIGSLMITIVLQTTGSYRLAILALVVFFIAGGLLLSRVDFRRGALAVGNQAPEII